MCTCVCVCGGGVKLSALLEFVSKTSSSHVQLFVIQLLTCPPSSVHFDGLTKTKTVAAAIQKVMSLTLTYTSSLRRINIR